MRSAVALVRCTTYGIDDVRRAVREAVDLLGGIERFVRPDERVLLKPNLLAAHLPESAVCTHPSVTQAVAEMVIAAGARCVVGDGPSVVGESPAAYGRVLDVTGTRGAAEGAGASIVRFDDGHVDVEIPHAKVFRHMALAEAVVGADVIVDLPKFKTHELTRFTGAVKNLYGCIPGRRKLEFHLQAGDNPTLFAQILVDLLLAVRPTLSIMDGIRGMDGSGPSSGRPRDFGLIIASTDPVALDAVACFAAGLDPMSVPMLRLADEQGVGIADGGSIDILGEDVESVRIPDFRTSQGNDMVSRVPRPIYRMLKSQLTRKPTFRRSACTGCHQCARACPACAITGEGKKLRIDYVKCIRCFCCQEVCPQGAIRIKTGVLRRLLLSLRRK